MVEFVIERYLERHKPLCINNCTDSSHGICDVTSQVPFQLGTCVCRPGWKGYDCSEKEHEEKSKYDSLVALLSFVCSDRYEILLE